MRVVINVTDVTPQQMKILLQAMNQKDIGQQVRAIDHPTLPGWMNLRVLTGESDVDPAGALVPPTP